MSYRTLCEDDKKLYLSVYREVMETISDDTGGSNADLILKAFYDSPVSFEVKYAIAYKEPQAKSSILWGYENFTAKDIGRLFNMASINRVTAIALVKNPNLDLGVLELILTSRITIGKSSVQTFLIEQLPESMRTAQTYNRLLEIHIRTRLEREFILKEAAKTFGFDESVPLSWVEKLVLLEGETI